MSWRFRKTFKVLPGVKLNLTRHGLSATLGAAPLSINAGPKGVYRNVSIPGTGIWDRQRIGGPTLQPSGIQPPTADYASPTIPSLPPPIPVSPSPATEIHSASTELLTSESLEHLRRLLTDAYIERDELTKDVSSATLESETATRRYQNWQRGFLMKRLFKHSFTTRKESADMAVAKLEELQEQLRLTTIATEITVDREQAEPYYRMRDEFAALSESQKIWNLLTEQAIDRIAERSTADTAITREPVSFSLGSCDLIQWEQEVPHLPNRTGGDMYVYPGFILYRASKQAFALIDFHDVLLKVVSWQFTEHQTIPSDTQVVGQTWAKSNKDGSPDRRFHNNYQIPVVHYGSLLFSSPDGLDVRYLCSNAALAERFAKAWTVFRTSLGGRQESNEADGAEQGTEPYRILFSGAFETFKSAHETFCQLLFTAAKGHEGEPTSKVTITRDFFMAYMATVVGLIDAARELEAKSNLRSSTRAKFRRAIETFEAAWKFFEKCVQEGCGGTEAPTTYLNAVNEFIVAMTRFPDARPGGGTRSRRRDA
jgi:hypothetical protein